MGKITGFIEIERRDRTYTPVPERIKVYKEFIRPLSDEEMSKQGARCMDCGIPFCQTGCPVNNIIPDWNDLLPHRWREAMTSSTRPTTSGTTGAYVQRRAAACVLNINNDPVRSSRSSRPSWTRLRRGVDRAGLEDRQRCRRGIGPGSACAQHLARAARRDAFRRATASAASCDTASPTSRWRSTHRPALEQMTREGVTFRPACTWA